MDNNFDLFKALEAFEPFDNNEAEHMAKVKRFLATETNCFSRTNLKGHVQGGGFLLNSKKTKILLNHHARLNDWFHFDGHSDGEMNTMNVATRETREESGIQVFTPVVDEIFDIDVHSVPENVKKQEPAHTHYDIRFLFETENEKFQKSHESNNLRWFTIDEYKQLKPTEARVRFLNKWGKLTNDEQIYGK